MQDYRRHECIEQIISTVNEVAFQTNLLALKMPQEAAFPDEPARYLPRVAAEVRSLGQKTTIAAQEIKVLIQDTGERISSGDTLVKQSGTSLKECMFLMKELTQAIDDIATSTKEQASGVDELTKAISEIDSTTQRNSAIVEEPPERCITRNGDKGSISYGEDIQGER